MIVKRLFFLFAALVLLAASAHGADRLPPMARQALHKAQVHMDNGRHAEAAAGLREYMAEGGDEVPAQVYLMLGGAYHAAEKFEAALEAFSEGVRAFPENPLLVRNCGVAYYGLGRYVDAARLFEKAYALITPSDPVLLFQAGSAYYGGEDYKRSARVMDALLDAVKTPKKDWVRLAIHAHIQAGQSARAEVILRSFLAAHPEEGEYWELLAKLYLEREEFEEAASVLEICYRLRTPTTQELERLASVYRYSNAPLLASATLRRAHPDASDAEIGLKIARLYASAGRSDEAVRVLSRYNASGEIDHGRGRILYEARRFDEAAEAFQAVVDRDPKAAESRYLLAMCAWEKRDWKAAKRHFSGLSGNKRFGPMARSMLTVIDDIENARREAGG